MDLQEIVRKLQRELTCSICLKSFLNPTTLACGHNFCHSCLESYWGEFPTITACPQCMENTPQLSFITNVQLANITKLVEELSLDIKQITAEGRVCKKHPPALKAFCKNELVLFCSMCDSPQEHLTHDVVPVAEAAREYKGQLLNVMRTLKDEKERISKYHSDERTEAASLIQQLEEERQFVIAEFNGIRQFLEQQEHFLLLRVIENLEKGIMWEKAKHAAVLFREVSTFDELIQTVKEKCQQSAVELLQDVGSTLKRCKQTLTNPVSILPWMKLIVWDLFDFNAFLGILMKQFKDVLVAGYQIHKANVTLDPDTAHPRLILSEDLKSCWMGTKSQQLVQDNRRFDHMMCVLGRERFVTGRHYWEVAVENEGDWGVGVARSSVKRKGVKALCKMEGIWAMTKRYGSLWEYINPPALISEPIHWEIKKIRVSLNYHGGRVAFCDGERGNLLHAFSVTSFAGEPIYPFFWIRKKTRISICP
ncbi:zinc finger protein RFP-like [Thamnophis elegans]|uniref:zinc finger protein RFP-like n=1 Tax=Thamnophis elegans TaxID=35005 RepID=UPI0013770C08|nr:zinc finger protein RFP-like [Thamnophis elegans]